MPPTSAGHSEKNFSSRRWWFRALAVVLGLAPFLLAEVILRVVATEAPIADADPFVEFAGSRPLFELDASRRRMEISPARRTHFKADSFAHPKPPGEFRIFCLGGSTVQGNPYAIETAFSTWLELALQAADDSHPWEAVNCGGISYSSYRLLPILRECLDYQPDLILLYVGDNEFLESREYTTQVSAGWRGWLLRGLSHSRLLDQVSRAFRESPASPADQSVLAAEVDALLDYQGGLAEYHRDDDWHAGVALHFRFAVGEMIRECQQAGVPILLMDPVCNLKDCPPFKALPGEGVSEEVRRLGEAALEETKDLDARLELLETVVQRDPRHAGWWYAWGQALREAGRYDEAFTALLRAKDEDLCPLRLTEPLRRVLHDLATETNTPLVPVFANFRRQTADGIPGAETMLDHVHPTITGQQWIADWVYDSLRERGFVQPRPGWEVRRQQRYREHLASLDAPYYARGQEHLRGLELWTQGRAKKWRGGTAPGEL